MRTMSASIVVAGAVLLGAGPAHGAGNLKSATIVNTGSLGGYVCDSTPRTTTWTNNTGSTIYIKKAQVWQMLGEPNQKADLTGWIVRLGVGDPFNSLLVQFALQSYANPNNTSAVMQNDFSPEQFILPAGGQVQAYYNCVPRSTPVIYFSMFNIWYTVGSP